MQWTEVNLDKSCAGNCHCKVWISDDGKWYKKGTMIYGKWQEVIYEIKGASYNGNTHA